MKTRVLVADPEGVALHASVSFLLDFQTRCRWRTFAYLASIDAPTFGRLPHLRDDLLTEDSLFRARYYRLLMLLD